MSEIKTDIKDRLHPNTKNYYQKLFVRKIFGKKLYKYFKTLKIILYFKLGKEFEISGFLKQIIKNDIVIFDIGANLGQYELRFSDFLKGKGKVICVEPVYENYVLLEKIRKFFCLSNVVCFNYAVSDYEKESTLYIPVIKNDIELDTRATVDLDNYYFNYEKYNKQPVNVITLHSLTRKLNLNKVDIIKSDTEGNDGKVILGSLDLIKTHLPLILVEDSHEKKWLDEIYKIGYCPFYVINNLYLTDAFKTGDSDWNVKYDLLVLIHKSKFSEYKKYFFQFPGNK